MNVFDVFKETPYTLLITKRGKLDGNIIVKEVELSGIFKQRENQATTNNIELYQSSATLHVHPEDYEGIENFVGLGIRVNGIDYEVQSMTRGTNFDSGITEHLTFTLERAEFSE